MKKTIPVERVKELVNAYLTNMPVNIGDGRMEEGVRLGAASLLEMILHETGNYQGYRYLKQDEVPKGAKPGIITDPVSGEHTFPDDSRRRYY